MKNWRNDENIGRDIQFVFGSRIEIFGREGERLRIISFRTRSDLLDVLQSRLAVQY